MLKDIIAKYKISDHITLKVIKTTLFGITVKTTCYFIDENKNIKKII